MKLINPIKISAVSYLNTLPFIHGITEYFNSYPYELSTDIPSVCATKLLENKVDLALVPVTVIPKLSDCRIVTSFCIGANGHVASVMLYSQLPLQNIRKVYLDYQSMTSVNLVKVLANNYWNIQPQWMNANEGYEKQIKDDVAGVIIGDRALEMRNEYEYQYDLAEEWRKYTGLPFAFACWVAHKNISDDLIVSFEDALTKGVEETDKILEKYKGRLSKNFAREYILNNISYRFGEDKKKAMNLFFNHISNLECFAPMRNI